MVKLPGYACESDCFNQWRGTEIRTFRFVGLWYGAERFMVSGSKVGVKDLWFRVYGSWFRD
jgi:hypothetical protein